MLRACQSCRRGRATCRIRHFCKLSDGGQHLGATHTRSIDSQCTGNERMSYAGIADTTRGRNVADWWAKVARHDGGEGQGLTRRGLPLLVGEKRRHGRRTRGASARVGNAFDGDVVAKPIEWDGRARTTANGENDCEGSRRRG
jgi:hypothetical protein